jgi:hypothetical protein
VTVFLAPYLSVNLLAGVVTLLWVILDFLLRRGVKRTVRTSDPFRVTSKFKYMEVNYKVIDTKRIVDYLESFPQNVAIPVEDIMRNSGAEHLRVYPALFEMEQSGYLEVVERESFGAHRSVRRR